MEGENLNENIICKKLFIKALHDKLEVSITKASSNLSATVRKRRALLQRHLLADAKKLIGERTVYLKDKRVVRGVICKSQEKFITFTVERVARIAPDSKLESIQLRLRDTFDNTILSLKKLAKKLANQTPILDKALADRPKLLKLLKEKGSYL